MRGCRALEGNEIDQVREAFRGPYAARDRALFALGIKQGRRISQMLSLRVKDVLGEDGRPMERIYYQRRNVKGRREGESVVLHPEARAALLEWIREMEKRGPLTADAPLFSSRKGGALDRRSAWRILRGAYRRAGLSGKLGTHTLRKTVAARAYEIALERMRAGEKVDPIRRVQAVLNHKRITSTIHYLARDDESVDQTLLAI